MWAVIAHGFMEENDVKSTCGGTKFDFKIKKGDNINLKSDAF